MASALQLTISEYLDTSYRPDREYIDGELREQSVGEWEHARVQALLAAWFANHESEWGVLTATEQRVRVSSLRVRIPDLVLVRGGQQPDVLIDPPLLVVEILSPDDTYSDTQERAEDYFQMGVSIVWIVDPKTRTARMCTGEAWVSSLQLKVLGTTIYADLRDIFSRLDQRSSTS